MAPRLLAMLLLAPFAVGAQNLPWQTHPQSKELVEYTFPEQIALTRGRPQEVDLHFRIRDGFHINSHQPHDKGLIRTELIVAEPPGLDVQKVDFPQGVEFASKAFPEDKLSVYTGEVVLHARLMSKHTGEEMLQAALRYQACDADRCFPPKEAPVALDIITH